MTTWQSTSSLTAARQQGDAARVRAGREAPRLSVGAPDENAVADVQTKHMPTKKSHKRIPPAQSRAATKDRCGNEPVSMFFGRGFEAFDLAGIGVPRPLKGKRAVKVAVAAGIITPSGKLAKRYR
jgi:hypothetical protein